ncbi:MAG: hypothetical protein AB8G86_15150 [Saprospiraceae bacterium]
MKKKISADKPIRSKLLPILAELDKDFLDNFKKQLRKEGAIKRDMLLIFNYCLKHHPNYQSIAFYQEYAYQKIFKTPFNYTRLMRGLSNIFLRLEQYLIEYELEKTPFFKDYLLAKAYNRHNLNTSFQQLISKKTTTPLNSSTIEHALERLKWNHLAYFSGVNTKIGAESTSIKKASNALDLYFVGIKLKHLCELAARQSILGEAYFDEFENNILDYCDKHAANLPVVYSLYNMAFKLIKNSAEKKFQLFSTQYQATWSSLASEDQVVLLTYLMNYATRETRKNKAAYLPILFQLYQFGIEKRILLINERFVEDHFVNLAYVASYLKEFDWLNQLLKEWEQQIKVWLTPSVFNLSMARFTFAQGLFSQCQDYLYQVDYGTYIYAFRAKALEIACSYELNEPLLRINSQCKAYENYLRNHSNRHHEYSISGLNFIYIIRQLNKINPRKERLLQSYQKLENIPFSEWLLEKIKALK